MGRTASRNRARPDDWCGRYPASRLPRDLPLTRAAYPAPLLGALETISSCGCRRLRLPRDGDASADACPRGIDERTERAVAEGADALLAHAARRRVIRSAPRRARVVHLGDHGLALQRPPLPLATPLALRPQPGHRPLRRCPTARLRCRKRPVPPTRWSAPGGPADRRQPEWPSSAPWVAAVARDRAAPRARQPHVAVPVGPRQAGHEQRDDLPSLVRPSCVRKADPRGPGSLHRRRPVGRRSTTALRRAYNRPRKTRPVIR
jgi:hypothetical protein